MLKPSLMGINTFSEVKEPERIVVPDKPTTVPVKPKEKPAPNPFQPQKPIIKPGVEPVPKA